MKEIDFLVNLPEYNINLPDKILEKVVETLVNKMQSDEIDELISILEKEDIEIKI